jgi:arginyl-tRNA synthetase
MLKNLITKEIEKTTKKLFAKEMGPPKGEASFSVYPTENSAFGDYASNVALVVKDTKKSRSSASNSEEAKLQNPSSEREQFKNPMDRAEAIREKLLQSEKIKEYISEIKLEKPGFINFFVKDEVYIHNIGEILTKKEAYGSNETLKDKKIIIEFTDPNPFKEFHIGHLVGNFIGESFAKISEFSGAEVKRACYQGDVGMHVAKTIYGLITGKKTAKKPAEALPKFRFIGFTLSRLNPFFNLNKKISLLGKAYSSGSTAFLKDGKAKKIIADINKKIYKKSNPIINYYYRVGRKWSLKYFERIYEQLGMEKRLNDKPASRRGRFFDYYFFESETGVAGEDLVQTSLKTEKEVFVKSEGAIVFPKEKSGLHTRVFINSEGLPTYEAKELGLSVIKDKTYSCDTSIVITGNEVNEYFKVLLKAMEFMLPDIAKKTQHISHGMLRLPTGKMASRTGDVIKATDLLNDIRRLTRVKTDRALPKNEQNKIAEKTALAAIKYSILKQSIGKDIIFDFEKSISFEGDSGPYLQYTYARARSVLEKAKSIITESYSRDIGSIKITAIEKLLQRFPEIVEDAQKEKAPQYICTYLIELARAFNSFYAKNQIIDSGGLAPYRLSLARAVAIVLKNGLNLLGIPTLERM